MSFAFADIERDHFDLVHDHSGFLGVAFRRYLQTPMAHTVHCAFDRRHTPSTSSSATPWATSPSANTSSRWRRRVWPGPVSPTTPSPSSSWPFTRQKDDYLLAFGRVCEAKGFHLSIEAAKRTGHRLIMAGVLQEPYREYFETQVAPHIDGEQIIYESEVSDARKRELFAHAKAFLFPITWPEPFGLVMIEAMATGTPVVALRHGSVPEIIDHGKTGFICDTFDEFVAAIGRVAEIDAGACRRAIETRFTVDRMIDDYEAIYRRVLKGENSPPARP